jgi:hypothetical protein
VSDLASINAVLQHQIKRTAREWLATPQATPRAGPGLARDTAGFEFVLQQSYRAEFGIAAEDAEIFTSISTMTSLRSRA